MNDSGRLKQALHRVHSTGWDVVLLFGLATLVMLEGYRVFVPYLVFEVDQSERRELATDGAIVFALTFLGVLIFRIARPRITLWIAVAGMVIARLGLQFTDDPSLRWKLGAGAVIAWAWLLIVLLPREGRQCALGIGFAFSIDLIIRALRGTVDLPWIPGPGSDLATIAIGIGVVLAAAAVATSDQFDSLEMSLVPSLRFLGIGSGIALWLLASGNPGFAEVRADSSLPVAFGLLAIGTLLGLAFHIARQAPALQRYGDRAVTVTMGLLAALAVICWLAEPGHWIELLMVPLFTFAVTVLTLHAAVAPAPAFAPGRWRTGAAITIGFLLQTAFVFLFFARSGPMELFLLPVAVLTLSGLAGKLRPALSLPALVMLQRVLAGIAVAMLLALGWLIVDGNDRPAATTGRSNLTVVTYNIQEGFSRENIWSLEETARTIEAYNPDIVLLQETTRGWLVMSSVDQVRWLADRLDMDYAYSGNSYDGLWGNAILTRFPIESEDSVIFSTTKNLRRGALSIEVATPDGPLLVIGTHLDNLGEGTEVRVEQVQELLDFWGGTTPALIGGDFNSDPGSPEWEAMVDAGFSDAAGDDATTTSEDERRIDYVWVSPEIDVTGYAVPDVWTSDHRPVVVSLSVQP